MKRHSRLAVRDRVSRALEAADFPEGLNDLLRLPAAPVAGALTAAMCRVEGETQRRAIKAMGAVVARLADRDVEAARGLMRRLIWNLNEESGTCAWGAPEAMAEIMAVHAGLAGEYAGILVSFIAPEGNGLEFDALLESAVRGISRLAETRPELVAPAAKDLLRLAGSPNPSLRSAAQHALALVRPV